jgi:hypothetical protein
METSYQDWNLTGGVYYPHEGMSQLAKRMMYNATQFNHAQLYLNEEVLSIDDDLYGSNHPYVFSIVKGTLFEKRNSYCMNCLISFFTFKLNNCSLVGLSSKNSSFYIVPSKIQSDD